MTARTPVNHRPEGVACPTPPIEDELVNDRNREEQPNDECRRHSDCDEGLNGRCVMMPRSDSFVCSYDQCASDNDCGEGDVCECNKGLGGVHICLSNNGCQINIDCGENGFCSPTFGECGDYSGIIAYQCHTSEDECLDDADCEGAGEGSWGGYCAYSSGNGHWQCQDSHCDG